MIGGLLLIVIGIGVGQPFMGIIGIVMVVLGLVMWGAGMARRD